MATNKLKQLIEHVQEIERAKESEFYGIRSILGCANWAMFYIILGAREAGKSYAVMEYFVKQ